jgi:hypothetical protein
MTNALDHIILPGLATAGGGTPLLRKAGNSAEVNAATLLVLGKALSSQDNGDVSDSLLLAQLAANTASDKFADPAGWTAKVSEVLGTIGWALQGEKTQSQQTFGPPIDWPTRAGAQFDTAFGTTSSLVRTAMAAAKGVAASDPAALLWNQQTFAPAKGAGLFQIALADTDGSGSVVLNLLTLSFSLTGEGAAILDWTSGADVSSTAQLLNLNADVYAKVRQQIITKLGDRVRTQTAQIAL